MVFKNFTGDISTVTSLTSELTLLGKSFKSVGEDYKTLQAMGNGKIKSFFSSIVSSSDTVALQNFHRELKAGKGYQVAYDTTMLSASETAQRQAHEYNTLTRRLQSYQRQKDKGILTEEQYNAKVQVTQTRLTALTAQTQKLTLKQRLLAGTVKTVSAAFSMLKMAAITFAITGVISLITEAIERGQEATEKAKELGKTARQTTDDISSLYSQYLALNQAVIDGTGSKEELKSTTNDLLKALGLEGIAVSTLTDKYGSLEEAVSSLSLETLKSAHGDLVSSVSTYRDELLKIGGSGVFGQNNQIPVYFTTSQNTDKDIRNIMKGIRQIEGVEDSLGTFKGGSEFVLALLGDSKTVDGIKQNYETLVKIRDVIVGTIGSEKAGKLDLYTRINERINQLKEAYDNYSNEITELNQNAAKTAILESLKGKELPKTQEEFNNFSKELVATATDSNSEIRQQFIGTEDEIKNAIIAGLESMSVFNKFVDINNETPNSVNDTTKSIEYLKSATSELKDAYDELAKKQDKFQSALDKVQKGTSLTSDEVLGLIEIYPQLASQFTKTADGWTISSENIISANEQVVKSVRETVQEQIDGYQEIIDKYNSNKDSLRNTVAQFKTGDNFMGMPSDVRSQLESTTSDELKQLADDAKEAQQQMDYLNLILQMLGVTTSDETKTLADYSKELSNTKSIVEDFKDTLENGGTLTTSDLQKALEKYPQLEDSLNQYLAGLKSQEQIYEELKTYYDQDLENFRTYLANKAVDDEDTWAKFIDNNSSWVEALADSYALDLANLTTYEQMSDAIKNNIMNNVPDTTAAYQTWLSEQGRLFERFKGVFGNVDDLIDTGSKSSSSSATSSSSLPDGYTKAKKELEHIYNMGEISTRDYYLRLNQLAEQWLKGNENYLDEYRSIQESVYSGLKSLYSDEINKQIEGYENVLDVLKNINQEKIDGLNKEKELLQDNADEEQRILDLKQAQIDLENAKKKTTWVITEQGLKQIQDESAVKEAQSALDKLELESKTAQIDKQISALENENDSYDKIKTDWQNKINLENAKQFIGSDNIQNAVTNGFKEGYRSALNEKENLDNLDKNGFNQNDPNYTYNALLKKLGSNLTLEQVADIFKKSDFTANFSNSYADKIKATTEKIVNNTSTTSNNSNVGDINIIINDATDPERVGEVVVEKIKRIANLWNNKPKNAAFI